MKRKWYFIVVLLLLFLGGCKKNTTKFEVSFDLNYPGGTLLTREVKKGETVEKPTDPLREGYLFLDWYLDLEDEEAFDFITPITNDIILLAKWEAVLLPDQVLVIFDYQYDNKREEFIVNIGSLLDEVVPGEREGYLFEGWFYEADLFDFETAIEEEITLYAFWI
ncbi:MAG: InlB B-repeat-containing protein, partial [Acholeplasmataceae bacterium]|nr:InlB B-repeat-containing protein [Acholeplasmataceae bacterium]